MRKKLIPILLAVILLTTNAYAAESSAAVQSDESAVVTVTDITLQGQATMEISTLGSL